MRKKLFSFFLVMVFAFVFVGCKKQENPTPQEPQKTPTDEKTPVDPSQHTEPVTPVPTVEPKNKYTITYEYDESSEKIDGELITEVEEGGKVALPNVIKEGYVFLGWSLSTGGPCFDSIEDVKGNLILKTNFEIIRFEVKFDLDGGSTSEELPTHVNYGGEITLPTLTKEGYEFKGFKVNGEGELVTGKLSDIKEELNLVAVFEELTFALTYDLDGGTTLQELPATAKYNQTIKLLPHTKEGYQFNGFSVNGSSALFLEVTVKGDTTIKAMYSPLKFTVTYLTSGVSVDLPTTISYGEVVNLPELTKSGYEFKGWTLDGEAVTSITGTKDLEVVAVFERVVCLVSYELNGGTLLNKVEEVPYGGTLTLETCYKQGNKFLGWTIKDSSSSSYVMEVNNVTSAITVVANFEEDASVVLVGEGFYESIAAALEHVSDGGTITLLPGSYPGGTINKEITLKGSNYGLNPNLSDRNDESLFTADLKIEANNVTLDGIALTGAGRVYAEGNIANLTIKNMLVVNSTVNPNAETSNTAPIYAIAYGESDITNLVIDSCRYETLSTGRPMILFGSDINGLTIINCEFLGGTAKSNYNDGIKIINNEDKGHSHAAEIKYGIKGSVIIRDNVFSNYSQYLIWFRMFGNGNFVIENNQFNSIGQTAASHGALTLIKDGTDGVSDFNITMRGNTFNDSVFMARFDNLPTNANVNITYNKMNNCSGDFYVKNGASTLVNCDYNYYGVATPVESKFKGCGSHENTYTSASEVPTIGELDSTTYTITYDLAGGEWEKSKYTIDDTIDALLVALTAYYGTDVTATNLKDVSENASVKLFDFMDKAEWTWLRDYMIYCRKNDEKQSSGASYLEDKSSSYCNTYWRYEMQGFLNKKAWDGWPYSSDYASLAYKEYFDEIAIYGAETKGAESYVYGVGTKLVTPVKDNHAFVGWFDETGNKYAKVGFNANKDLTLTAKWAPAIQPQEFVLNTNLNGGIKLYDTVQLEWEFVPLNTYNQKVTFSSSNESIFKVDKNGLITTFKAGTAVLKITVDADKNLNKEITINVYKPDHFDISYDTESYVAVDGTIKLNAEYLLKDGTKASISWENFDDDIVKLEDGVVTGLEPGFAQLRAYVSNDSSKYVDFYVTVLPNNMSDAMKEIVSAHNSDIFIRYNLGVGSGTPAYYTDVVQSISQLLFNEPLEINRRYEATQAGVDSNHGGEKSSTEFITVHYTGNMAKGATAAANASYFASGGGGTSIHYVTGNDGVFHCLDDKLVGFHAGDGTSVTFEWIPTGVKYAEGDPLRPVFGINKDSKFTINGKDTTVSVPTGTTPATTKVTDSRWINNMGLAFKVVDGEYYMGTTWWCYTQVSEGRICNKGGNLNSIGIESAVNEGTDLWYTWHKTAQLVAQLMVENNLDITRVVGHHFFSAKDCPQPFLANGMELWAYFIDMVEHEYNLITLFKDYEVTMELENGYGCVNNFGRVTIPTESTVVTYKVTLVNKLTNDVEQITLASSINGIYKK